MFNPENKSVGIIIGSKFTDEHVSLFNEAYNKHGQVVFFISGEFQETAKLVREGLPNFKTDHHFICVPHGTGVPNIMEIINENSFTE